MLGMLDSFAKAVTWTVVAALLYLAALRRARAERREDPLSRAIGDQWVTWPVLNALVMTCLMVAGLEFLLLPTLFFQPVLPASQGNEVVEAFALPDANVSVLEVRGPVSERPTTDLGEWQVGSYRFAADARTTIHADPGRPVAACLVQVDGGTWKAATITDEAGAPHC